MKFLQLIFTATVLSSQIVFGQAQVQDDPKTCYARGEVLFLIDGSDSILDTDFQRQKDFVLSVANSLYLSRINGMRVGCIAFSTRIHGVPLTQFDGAHLFEKAIGILPHDRDGTETHSGIKYARTIFRDEARANVPRILVILTDGFSQMPALTVIQSRLAKDEGITIITVGIGRNNKGISDKARSELVTIAFSPELTFLVPSFEDLMAWVPNITQTVCELAYIETLPLGSDNFTCPNAGEIIFMVDGSDSMLGTNFTQEKDFVLSVVDTFRLDAKNGIRVGGVAFSSATQVIPFKPFKNTTEFRTSFGALIHEQESTFTHRGIQDARTIFNTQARENMPKTLVILTDGASRQPELTADEANVAKLEGVTIVVVGIGRAVLQPNSMSRKELEGIASSRELTYFLPDFDSLMPLVANFSKILCDLNISPSELVPSAPQPPAVGSGRLVVRPGPLIPNPDSLTDCAYPADIMFMVDGSDSMNETNFEEEKDFVVSIVKSLHLNPLDGIRAGGLAFSARVQGVPLRPFLNVSEFEAAFDALEHDQVSTSTHLGIQYVRDIFRSQARPAVPKVLLILTDGYSRRPLLTAEQAGEAKKEGISILTIGIVSRTGAIGEIAKSELLTVASSSDFVYIVPAFNELPFIMYNVTATICDIIALNSLLQPPPGIIPPNLPPIEIAPPITTRRPITRTNSPRLFPPVNTPPAPKLNCQYPAEIMFMVDGSDSMTGINFNQEKDFVLSVINALYLNPVYGIRVAGLAFSDRVQGIPLRPFLNKTEFEVSFGALVHDQLSTSTHLGILYTRNTFRNQARPGAAKVLVLLTDGRSRRPQQTAEQADLAKKEGITIMAVGIGSGNTGLRVTAIQELNATASSSELVFLLQNFNDLALLETNFTQALCSIIALDSLPPPPTRPVAPNLPLPQPTLPPAIPAVPECLHPADIMFMVEGSNSLQGANFEQEKDFVLSIVNSLYLNPADGIRAGGLAFSDRVQGIPLRPFRNAGEFETAFRALVQDKDSTSTHLGIQYTRDIFRNQARPGVPKVLIMLTVGSSRRPQLTASQAQLAKQEGIVIMSIGIGAPSVVVPASVVRELDTTASLPNLVFLVPNFSLLSTIQNSVTQSLCIVLANPQSFLPPSSAPRAGQPSPNAVAPPTVTTTTPRSLLSSRPIVPQLPPEIIVPPPNPTLRTAIPVVSVPECLHPADIMFMVEGSNSLQGANFEQEKDFVLSIVNSLYLNPADGIRAGGLAFSDRVQGIPLRPFRNAGEFETAFRALVQDKDSTSTHLGIQYTRDIFRNQARPGVPKVLIMLTVGSSRRPQLTASQAQLAKQEGIVIMSIGIGAPSVGVPASVVRELDTTASLPNLVFLVPNFSLLSTIQNSVTRSLCNVLASPQSFLPPSAPTLPRLSSRNPVPPPTITRPTTTARPPRPVDVPVLPKPDCQYPAEVIFMIDGSDTLLESHFEQGMAFFLSIADSFYLNPVNGMRVGGVTLNSGVQGIPLNPFKNTTEFRTTFGQLRYGQLPAPTDLGIEFARNTFNRQTRNGVPKVLVILTDQLSSQALPTLQEADRAKQEGVNIIMIGIGSPGVFGQRGRAELESIASADSLVFLLPNFFLLSQLQDDLTNVICVFARTASSAGSSVQGLPGGTPSLPTIAIPTSTISTTSTTVLSSTTSTTTPPFTTTIQTSPSVTTTNKSLPTTINTTPTPTTTTTTPLPTATTTTTLPPTTTSLPPLTTTSTTNPPTTTTTLPPTTTTTTPPTTTTTTTPPTTTTTTTPPTKTTTTTPPPTTTTPRPTTTTTLPPTTATTTATPPPTTTTTTPPPTTTTPRPTTTTTLAPTTTTTTLPPRTTTTTTTLAPTTTTTTTTLPPTTTTTTTTLPPTTTTLAPTTTTTTTTLAPTTTTTTTTLPPTTTTTTTTLPPTTTTTTLPPTTTTTTTSLAPTTTTTPRPTTTTTLPPTTTALPRTTTTLPSTTTTTTTTPPITTTAPRPTTTTTHAPTNTATTTTLAPTTTTTTTTLPPTTTTTTATLPPTTTSTTLPPTTTAPLPTTTTTLRPTTTTTLAPTTTTLAPKTTVITTPPPSTTTTTLTTTTPTLPLAPSATREKCSLPAEIFITLDGSDHLSKAAFGQQKDFAMAIADSLFISELAGSRIGAVAYGSRVQGIPFLPFQTLDQLKLSVANLVQDSENTFTDLGIQYARDIFRDQSRDRLPKILIILSSTVVRSPETYLRQAVEAKREGVIIISVGIQSGSSGLDLMAKTYLQILASDRSLAFLIEDYSSLPFLLSNVTDIMCDLARKSVTPVSSPTTESPAVFGSVARITDASKDPNLPPFGVQVQPASPSGSGDVQPPPHPQTVLPDQPGTLPSLIIRPPQPNVPSPTPSPVIIPPVEPFNPYQPMPPPLVTETVPTPREIPPPNLPSPEGYPPTKDCVYPAELIFMVDASDSLFPVDFFQEKEFVVSVVNRFYFNENDGVRVGGIGYSSNIQNISLSPFQSISEFQTSFRRLDHQQESTHTHLGIQSARETFQQHGRPGVPKVLIILTDGRSKFPSDTNRQASLAKQEGVRIITVGISPRNSQLSPDAVQELRSMASSEALMFLVGSFNDLPSVKSTLVQTICDLIAPPPPITALPGEIRTSAPQPTTTSAPFIRNPVISKCQHPSDLIFLIDGSATSTDITFLLAREFVLSVTDSFHLNEVNGTRVAGIVYDSTLHSVPLVPFQNSVNFHTKMRSLSFNPTVSFANEGINYARQMFLDSGREGVPKVLVILRDGFTQLPPNTLRQSLIARTQNIAIITVGREMTEGVVGIRQELQSIASSPELFYAVDGFTELESIGSKLVTDICDMISPPTRPAIIVVPPEVTTPPPPPSVKQPTITPAPRTSNPTASDSECHYPGDVIFLLDGSPDSTNIRFLLAREFALLAAESLYLDEVSGTRVAGILSDSTLKRVPFRPFLDSQGFQARMRSLTYNPTLTSIDGGIGFARELFAQEGRNNVPKILVILRDGYSPLPLDTLRQSLIARAQNIAIITVGLLPNQGGIGSQELQSIASSPQLFYGVNDFTDLQSIGNQLVQDLCDLLSPPPVVPSSGTPGTPVPTPPSPTVTQPTTTPPPAQRTSGPVFTTSKCHYPGDLIFLMDGSGSSTDMKFMLTREFVLLLADSFTLNEVEGSRVAGIVFNSTVQSIPFRPFQHSEGFQTKMRALPYNPKLTFMDKGIEYARQMFSQEGREGVPKLLVILRDGYNPLPPDSLRQSLIARTQKIDVLTVGLDPNIPDAGRQELEALASSSELFFAVNDFSYLQSIGNRLATDICEMLSQRSTIELPSLATQSPTIPVLPAAQIPSSDAECREKGDLVFLLDGSDKISESDFLHQTDFVSRFADKFYFSPVDGLRTGVIVFGNQVKVVQLDPFLNQASLKSVVNLLTHDQGSSVTDAGVRFARELFTEEGRPRTHKVLVAISDGEHARPVTTRDEFYKAKDEGTIVVTIGVGKNNEGLSPEVVEELRSFASSADLAFLVPNFSSLPVLLNSLALTICDLLKSTLPPDPPTTPAPTPVPTPAPIPVPPEPRPPLVEVNATVPAKPAVRALPSCPGSPPPLQPGDSCAQPGDVLFIVDASNTISKENFALQQEFIMCLVNSMYLDESNGARVAGMAYSGHTQSIPFNPVRDAATFWNSFSQFAADNSSAQTNNTIQLAREMFRNEARPNVPKIIVLFTDGKNVCPGNTLQLANEAKRENIIILTVGISETGLTSTAIDELRSLASTPDLAFVVQKFSGLKAFTGRLLQELCSILKPGSRPILPGSPALRPLPPHGPKLPNPNSLPPQAPNPYPFNPPSPGYSGFVPRLLPSKPEAAPVPVPAQGGEAPQKESEELPPESPQENEFISDTFADNHLNEEDLRKEMQQLGMQGDTAATDKGEESEIPEWEQELQKELQDYEVVTDGVEDEDLENEILQQLEEEGRKEGK